jgi:hypothetical protein
MCKLQQLSWYISSLQSGVRNKGLLVTVEHKSQLAKSWPLGLHDANYLYVVCFLHTKKDIWPSKRPEWLENPN